MARGAGRTVGAVVDEVEARRDGAAESGCGVPGGVAVILDDCDMDAERGLLTDRLLSLSVLVMLSKGEEANRLCSGAC